MIFIEKNSKDDWKYTDLSQYNLNDFSPGRTLGKPNLYYDKQNLLQKLQPLLIDAQASQQWIFYNDELIQASTDLPFSYTENAQLTLPICGIISDPIYIVYITESYQTPLMTRPKTAISVQACSEATLIELYVTLGEKSSFTHVLTDITLAKGAKLKHFLLQRTLAPALNIVQMHIQQTAYSHYIGTSMMTGGKTNRTAFNIDLNGSNAHCQFYAFTAAKQKQCLDTYLQVQHNQPDSDSVIVARGVICDEAKASFTGKIKVQKGATKTKASLENKNLLLSSLAEANTRPQLEIYNEDIQCSHGATVGHLELDALFYLRSRGIPETEALQLLIDAFIAPSIETLSPLLQNYLKELIHEH